MLIGIDALGNVINRDQENIFQGSNLANEVKVVSELSSNVEMKVQFLTPRYTTKEITLVSEGQVASGVNLWSGGIPYAVTQYYGMVKCQIKAYNGTQIIASGACDFEVKKGFEEELPPEPDPDVYLQIIQELVNVRAGLVNKVDISYANDGVSQVINNDENGLKLSKGDTYIEVQADKVVYNDKEIATKEYSDTGIANHNVSSSAHQDIRDMITDWTANVARKDVDNNFSVSQSVNGKRLATEEYVDINSGKIDKIKQNNVELEIIDKTVDIDAYTKQQSDDKFALETDVAAIESKIPNEASSSNQLADKDFTNSSIATATATYRGNYDVVGDLGLTADATNLEVATALGTKILVADNNDYCFVTIPTGVYLTVDGYTNFTTTEEYIGYYVFASVIDMMFGRRTYVTNENKDSSNITPGTTVAYSSEILRVDRYKYNGTNWLFEYTLNNSGFTASQWATINSGITSTSFNNKMDKTDPVGSGSLSLNRAIGSSVGQNSATVGSGNTASGHSAFAGGVNTIASGDNANSQGYVTIAQRKSQFVFGEFNIADTTGADETARGEFVEIVGNGNFNGATINRSNARTLDWDGNEELAGNIILKGGKLGDGNNATYKLAIPDTTSWTADKNIATTDQIPTVNDATITITQGGVTKGTFTLNQGSANTIALDSGTEFNMTDVQITEVD